MSTEVKLVGIGAVGLRRNIQITGVMKEVSELGFSNLARDLEKLSNQHPEILVPAFATEDGIQQYYIAQPLAFLSRVEKGSASGADFDSVGCGWMEALKTIQMQWDLSINWWLVVEW